MQSMEEKMKPFKMSRLGDGGPGMLPVLIAPLPVKLSSLEAGQYLIHL